jgi:alpha-D-ribose 1-methylphosphonate 5-triphosphate synthase subunit PhnI
LPNADSYQFDVRTSAGRTSNAKENPMHALTTLTRHYLVAPFQRTRTRLQLLARGGAGHALQAAATTLVLATTGGPEYLVNDLHLTWK